MDPLSLFLIALGLSMDAFAVSIASGVIIRKHAYRQAVVYGLMFGGFQMLMPIVGYGAGSAFSASISAYDHWIAFGLLFFIGAKMVYESFEMDEIEKADGGTSALTLLGLSNATSIDALAVGVSFSFLNVMIWGPALLIGVVTFVMSFAGVLIGNRFGHAYEKKVEMLGGLILVGIGVKILVEHLSA